MQAGRRILFVQVRVYPVRLQRHKLKPSFASEDAGPQIFFLGLSILDLTLDLSGFLGPTLFSKSGEELKMSSHLLKAPRHFAGSFACVQLSCELEPDIA